MFILSIILDFGLFSISIVSSQYLVDKDSYRKYLKYEFENTNNHIFPKNLSFSYHITHLAGLLFYSIDKDLNQFIVRLEEEEPIMNVYFRGKQYSTTLTAICNCKYDDCLYQKLNFQFQINEEIEISCNNGSSIKYSYATTRYNYTKYPFPNFGEKNKSAYLWFINIPSDEDKDEPFSNGCISDIFYNGISLNTTTPGSFKKCINLCKPDSCNGGNCVERYDQEFMCDCETTFNNGKYCNESKHFSGTLSDDFKIKILKASWNCNASRTLLRMYKSDSSIIISTDRLLKLVYRKNGVNYSADAEIHGNGEYVLLMIFENSAIKYRIIYDKNTIKYGSVNFVANKNSADWNFKNITFNNTCSDGSIVSKTSNDIKWMNIYKTTAFISENFHPSPLKVQVRTFNQNQITEKPTKDKITKYTSTEKPTKDKITKYTVSLGMLSIFIIVLGTVDIFLFVIIIWFLYRRCSKKAHK